MKNVHVITAARSDYGILRPILRALSDHPAIRPGLLVCGAHLCEQFGYTVRLVEEDGYEILSKIESTLASDTPQSIALSTALAASGFAREYARRRPDLLLLLGDRYEMMAAATAALPFNIPIAHIHGGEVSSGAMDDVIRHAISKMSHLHFTATETSRARLIRMGELPERVKCVGAPGLDRIRGTVLMNAVELSSLLDLSLDQPPILATFHPPTRHFEETATQVNALFTALEETSLPVIVTYPGADTSSHVILERIRKFAATQPHRVRLVANLDDRAYLSLMAIAAAMVGNSSSGIIEAASFELPVLNVGDRQRGRECGPNVVHVPTTREGVLSGLAQVLSPQFRETLKGLKNPYGYGNTAQTIAKIIAQTALDDDFVAKPFYDDRGEAS